MTWTVTLKKSVIDETAQEVSVILVGEKRGNSLIVQGEEFTAHYESDPTE